MRRTGLAAAACVVALGAAAGCLNFAEPTPGPGRLQAELALVDGDVPEARFRARYELGADEDGSLREPADPAVRILGRSVEPSGEGSALALAYASAWTPDPAIPVSSRAVLSGPRLSVVRPDGRLVVPLVWRGGRDSIRVAGGEGVALPLQDVPDGPLPEGLEMRWRLDVEEGGSRGPLYGAQGSGLPPDTLYVRPEVLEGGASWPLEASVGLEVRAEGMREVAGYGMELLMTTRLRWHLLRP